MEKLEQRETPVGTRDATPAGWADLAAEGLCFWQKPRGQEAQRAGMCQESHQPWSSSDLGGELGGFPLLWRPAAATTCVLGFLRNAELHQPVTYIILRTFQKGAVDILSHVFRLSSRARSCPHLQVDKGSRVPVSASCFP